MFRAGSCFFSVRERDSVVCRFAGRVYAGNKHYFVVGSFSDRLVYGGNVFGSANTVSVYAQDDESFSDTGLREATVIFEVDDSDTGRETKVSGLILVDALECRAER